MEDLLRLLAEAGAGDHAAQTEVYARFHEGVRAKAHRQIQLRLRRWHHPVLAVLSTGDIVQEVFRDLFRDVGELHFATEEQLVGLLATLVEHRLVDQLRRYHAARRDVRRQVAVEDTDPAEAADWHTPLELAAANENVDIYEELVAGLPSRERALLEMRLRDQTPFEEMARALAYPSTDAARKAFHRAHARLLLALRRRGVGSLAGSSAERDLRERAFRSEPPSRASP